MATKEELQELADQEIEDAKPLYKVVNNVREELSDDDYLQAKIDLGNVKWNNQEYGYIENRKENYLPISEQLDLIYWDNVNGTTKWKEHIAKVKADFPKPS